MGPLSNDMRIAWSGRFVIKTLHLRFQLFKTELKEPHNHFLGGFILTFIKPIDDDDDIRRGVATRILGQFWRWTENKMRKLSIEGTRKDMRNRIHRLLDQMLTFQNGRDDTV